MTANSAIFSTSLFGNSSGSTAAEQAEIDTHAKEIFLAKTSTNNLRTKVPVVPSNQKYMRD
jgi:hypothetical protein